MTSELHQGPGTQRALTDPPKESNGNTGPSPALLNVDTFITPSVYIRFSHLQVEKVISAIFLASQRCQETEMIYEVFYLYGFQVFLFL